MKTRCYSVKLESVVEISSKALKVKAFDGSTAIIPKSMVFGEDVSVLSGDAYWIAAFILDKPECKLQHSKKKEAWFNERGVMLPVYFKKTHSPDKIAPVEDNSISSLHI